MNNKGMRYFIIFTQKILTPYLKFQFLVFCRQTLVTRVDQDFDIRRVQTQAEKFLPKAETLSRGRKRKAQASKQKSSAVRWVKPVFEEKNIYFPIIF